MTVTHERFRKMRTDKPCPARNENIHDLLSSECPQYNRGLKAPRQTPARSPCAECPCLESTTCIGTISDIHACRTVLPDDLVKGSSRRTASTKRRESDAN